MKKFFLITTITLSLMFALNAECGWVYTEYSNGCEEFTVYSEDLGDGSCAGDCGNCSITTSINC